MYVACVVQYLSHVVVTHYMWPVSMAFTMWFLLCLFCGDSEETYRKLWTKQPKLSSMNVSLRTYSGKQLEVLGSLRVNVKYQTQVLDCEVLVVKGAGPSLLGRDCLRKFEIDWKKSAVNIAASNHNMYAKLRSFKKKKSVSVRRKNL